MVLEDTFDGRTQKKVNEEGRVHAAGFVLAGGRSSRMGKDKALLTLGGEPLVKRAVGKLSEVCTEVAIAGGTDELFQFGRMIGDKRPGCGPLGGIVSALEQSLYEWNLFLPVDAPFVPVSVLKALLFGAIEFSGVCVMAQVQGRKHPLCGIYSTKALEILREELEGGRWKVSQAIEIAGPVKVMDFEDADWFVNLNTPEEFAKAETRLAALDT
jgi:molybdopterin-guanine dinucleotide biosynthesis protein A